MVKKGRSEADIAEPLAVAATSVVREAILGHEGSGVALSPCTTVASMRALLAGIAVDGEAVVSAG